ncbi:MAG TPA: D-aminoacyl-tRNA deacylase [Tepidisphaeraceae bacterium]
MICVIQRVNQASVAVDGQIVSQIGPGMLVLAAVHATDAPDDVDWTARKLAGLRIFAAGDRNFDRDVKEIGGSILLVSNFTVAGDARKGRRPSLSDAADPTLGRQKFDDLIAAVRAQGVDVQIGQFGADMQVALVNDGPVTFVLDSRDR